jgi:tetratricopeptide (TPR) repeat protein
VSDRSRDASRILDELLGERARGGAARLWRGYVAHALLFYRQNDLPGFSELLRVGARFDLGPGGGRPGAKDSRAPGPEAEEARRLAALSDAKAAEKALTKALERRPDAAELYVLRGLFRHERYWGSLRLGPASLRDFERAAELAPRCAWAHLFAGMTLEMQRLYTRALLRLDRAAALEPRWAWPRVLRGVCKWYQADFKDAVAELSEAARLAPKSRLPLLFLARAKSDLRDRSLVKDLDRALALSPDCGFSLSWRGRAMFVLERTPEALKDLERAMRALPDYDRGWSWLGVSYAELGRWKEAERLLSRARDLNRYYPTTLYPLARARFELGRVDAAARALREAAFIDRQGVWVEHRISMGHPNPACLRSLRELDRLIAARPRLAWARAWRGQTSLLLQNYRDAIRDLSGALAADARDPWAWTWRGETLRRLGCHDEALEDFDRALSLRPELSWAWAGRGECLLRLGRREGARKALEVSLGLQPRCAPALAWRGEARLAEGDHAGAAADLEQSLELSPRAGWVRAWLWRARARQGAWEAARDAAARLTADGGARSDDAWAALAWLEARAGEKAASARACARALKLNASNRLALRLRGGPLPSAAAAEALLGGGDASVFFSPDQMLSYCRRELGADCARALLSGDGAGALAAAEAATRGRRDIRSCLFRGWLKLRCGDAPGALEEAARALDETLDPFHAPALRLRADARRAIAARAAGGAARA